MLHEKFATHFATKQPSHLMCLIPYRSILAFKVGFLISFSHMRGRVIVIVIDVAKAYFIALTPPPLSVFWVIGIDIDVAKA